jgi:hypothetical protein
MHMATSVRVDEEVKESLDRLQGLLHAETGRRVSHSALLARLLAFAERRQAEFLGEAPPALPSRGDVAEHLRRARRYGVAIDVTRLDEELYGP